MANFTHEKRAQLYRDAIDQIVAGTVAQYSVLGQSFTKQDLQKLEALAEYHERKHTNSLLGVRAAMDVSKSWS